MSKFERVPSIATSEPSTQPLEESRTITAGRDFHPAPSVLNAKITKISQNAKLKLFALGVKGVKGIKGR